MRHKMTRREPRWTSFDWCPLPDAPEAVLALEDNDHEAAYRVLGDALLAYAFRDEETL